jgi:hypothetical protein
VLCGRLPQRERLSMRLKIKITLKGRQAHRGYQTVQPLLFTLNPIFFRYQLKHTAIALGKTLLLDFIKKIHFIFANQMPKRM